MWCYHVRLLFVLVLFSFTWVVKKYSGKTDEANLSAFRSRPAQGVLHFPVGGPTSKIIGSVSISADGYLIFPDSKVLEQYRQYLVGKTHLLVQTYLLSEGFNSHGATIYPSGGRPRTITDDEATDYLLSTDMLVQIDKVLYRPKASVSCTTPKWDFVLAMDIVNLDPTTLASIKAMKMH